MAAWRLVAATRAALCLGEKGVAGSIGGEQKYGTLMPSYGPASKVTTNRLTEQQLADLIAYVLSARNG